MDGIDPSLILIVAVAIGSVASFLTVRYQNGKLAREFEKRKRKYEVKLERYSVVVENLGLMHSFGDILKLTELVGNLYGRDDEAKPIERLRS